MTRSHALFTTVLGLALLVVGCSSSGLRADRWQVRAMHIDRALAEEATLSDDLLAELVMDPSRAVQTRALSAVERQRAYGATEALRTLVRRGDEMRPRALEVLAVIHGLDDVQIRAAIRDLRQHDTIGGRASAARALAEARAGRALPVIAEVAAGPGTLEDRRAARQAVNELARLDAPVDRSAPYRAFIHDGLDGAVADGLVPPAGARRWIEDFETSREVRLALARGLGSAAANEATVRALARARGHRDHRVQALAARGLVRMGSRGYEVLAPTLERAGSSAHADRMAEVVVAELRERSGDGAVRAFIRTARADDRPGVAGVLARADDRPADQVASTESR